MGAQEWLIIAVVVLVLFGGSQLPKLARSLGEAQKEFKKGVSDGTKDESAAKTEQSAAKTEQPAAKTEQPAKPEDA
jgi:sec-independent protein translocase protein TatA